MELGGGGGSRLYYAASVAEMNFILIFSLSVVTPIWMRARHISSFMYRRFISQSQCASVIKNTQRQVGTRQDTNTNVPQFNPHGAQLPQIFHPLFKVTKPNLDQDSGTFEPESHKHHHKQPPVIPILRLFSSS